MISALIKQYRKYIIITALTACVCVLAYFYFSKKWNIKYQQLIHEMELAILQCRKAEKNFLLRHDIESICDFSSAIKKIKYNSSKLSERSSEKLIIALLEEINIQVCIYENSFQDICGLYNTSAFGPVHDIALLNIIDESTLLKEPLATPTSMNTSSLIASARNMEYFINGCPNNSIPLISLLQARRWEKNFQKRYDKLTGNIDSKSLIYIEKAQHETDNIKNWLSQVKSNSQNSNCLVLVDSSIKQYENNLAQLTKNVDAFFIKKRHLLEAARSLDESIKTINGKFHNRKTSKIFDGIYYLHPRIPVHGQPSGNLHDVGSLVGNQSMVSGSRYCKNWVQFYFDQNGNYKKENVITSIYFHIWMRMVKDSIDIGYNTNGKYCGGENSMIDFITLRKTDAKEYSAKNGCHLFTGIFETNCILKEEDVYKFTLKLSGYAAYPFVAIDSKYNSYIIINQPSDQILKLIDNDQDNITDYDEMYRYATNPYDEDTDGDGFTDKTEIIKGLSPNSNNFYSGEVIKGVSNELFIEHKIAIIEDWNIEGHKKYSNTKFVINGDLKIKSGGSLVLENCILQIGENAPNTRIVVEKNGVLHLYKTKIINSEIEYWQNLVDGNHDETNSKIDIRGSMIAENCRIENFLGLKILEGSNVVIINSELINCTYLCFIGESDAIIDSCHIATFIGIPIYCKDASPVIRNSTINAEYAGIGIYCFNASPRLFNSSLFVCEDKDSDASALMLVNNSHPTLSNIHYNKKRVSVDRSSSILFR